MKRVDDYNAVMAELKRRGLPVTTGGNCNTVVCKRTRELFYWQSQPPLAVWFSYPEEEAGDFSAFAARWLADQQNRAGRK